MLLWALEASQCELSVTLDLSLDEEIEGPTILAESCRAKAGSVPANIDEPTRTYPLKPQGLAAKRCLTASLLKGKVAECHATKREIAEFEA